MDVSGEMYFDVSREIEAALDRGADDREGFQCYHD